MEGKGNLTFNLLDRLEKDFNQPVGLKMNPENRWVKKVETYMQNNHCQILVG
ncbi:MAG: hypothetical protein K2O65_10210 [Lachnospiraceae bacterium]|nr:hypothetical protein [Lachnospiraceae bacterium]